MGKIFYLPILLFFVSCSNDDNPNTFENDSFLECRNLKVREVELKDNEDLTSKVFQVTVENTCKLCSEIENFTVYNRFFMIDLETNDTIGRHDYAILSPPVNKSSKIYELDTDLDSNPDFKKIRFTLDTTCGDMEYVP